MNSKPEKFEKKSFIETVNDIDRIEYKEILDDSNPIILDTNFLFVPFEFTLDIISEIERLLGTNYTFYIYEGTLYELEQIEKRKTKNKKFLPLIATMLKQYDFKIIKSKNNYVDKDLLRNSNSKILTATNDSQLRKELWSIPVRVLYMRQRHYLEIT